MLKKNLEDLRMVMKMYWIKKLVPEDHLVRQVDAALAFDFIYEAVKPLYSEIGRPRFDPVVVFKLAFVQYLFGVRSMRQTIKEVETYVVYRWFLGLGFEDKVPFVYDILHDVQKKAHYLIFNPTENVITIISVGIRSP